MKVKVISVLEAQTREEAKILAEMHNQLYRGRGPRAEVIWSLTLPAPQLSREKKP